MRVLVFDLDDTLFDKRQFAVSGFRCVARYLMAECGIKENLFKRLVAAFDWGASEDSFQRILRSAGYEAGEELISRLVEIYYTHRPQISLYPDAEDVLRRIVDREHYGLGLVTDGNIKAQLNKAKALGLHRLIEKIVYNDRFGREAWKPSPRGYLAIQDYFGLQGGAYAYIGNNPAKDFIAPKQLGWETVRIHRKHAAWPEKDPDSELDAHHVVSSMYEAASVLRLDALCLS